MELNGVRKLKLLNLVVCIVFCLDFAFSNSVLAFGTAGTSTLRPESAARDGGNEVAFFTDFLSSTYKKLGLQQALIILADRTLDPQDSKLAKTLPALASKQMVVIEKEGIPYLVSLKDLSSQELPGSTVTKYTNRGELLDFIKGSNILWVAADKTTPAEVMAIENSTQNYLTQAGQENRIFTQEGLLQQLLDYNGQRETRGLSSLDVIDQKVLTQRLNDVMNFHTRLTGDLKDMRPAAFILDETGSFDLGGVGSARLRTVSLSAPYYLSLFDFTSNIAVPVSLVEAWMNLGEGAEEAYKNFMLNYSRLAGDKPDAAINEYVQKAFSAWKEQEIEKARQRLAQEATMQIAEGFRVQVPTLPSGVTAQNLIDAAESQLKTLVASGLFTDFRVNFDSSRGMMYVYTIRSKSQDLEKGPEVLSNIVDVFAAAVKLAGKDLTQQSLSEQISTLKLYASDAVTFTTPTDWVESVFGEREVVEVAAPTAGPYDLQAPDIATMADLKKIYPPGTFILFRAEVNVAANNGVISDPNHDRFVKNAETLRLLLDWGYRVGVIYHQSKDGDPAYIVEPFQHAEILNKMVGGNRVRTVNDLLGEDAIKAVKSLQPGQAVILQNVRAKDKLTGKNVEDSPYFVPLMKALFSAMVKNGISVEHRDSASVSGIEGMPTFGDGLMIQELEEARKERLWENPHVEAVGGIKIEKTRNILLKLDRTDLVLTGGATAETALVAAQMDINKEYSDQELLALATDVLGPSAAQLLQKADAGQFFKFLPTFAKLIKENPNKIALPRDMAYLEGDQAKSVALVSGKVPAGFDYTFNGIGPETDKYYAELVRTASVPFKSSNLSGSLVDSSKAVGGKKIFLNNMADTIAALSEVPEWHTGGGDTKAAVKALNRLPKFASLAGGARDDFLAGKSLPGVDFAIRNNPKKLVGKVHVPSTATEAQIAAHQSAFSALGEAIQAENGQLISRTQLFIRGTKVGTIKISPTLMSSVLKLSMGDSANGYAGMEIVELDTQNPWIDLSMNTLYTPGDDRRRLNLDAALQILAKDPNLALVLLQGEYNKKKDKWGTAGEIKTFTIEEKLSKLLISQLRKSGIDPASLPKSSAPIPAMVQVIESTIPGELKMALFIPTPNTDLYRLMQLAQDAGINMKDLLENSKEINDVAFLAKMEDLKGRTQQALLGEALPAPAPLKAHKAPDMSSFAGLKGLTFAGAEIDLDTQTIISRSRAADFSQMQPVIDAVYKNQKFVVIMVPRGSAAEQTLNLNFKSQATQKDLQNKKLNYVTYAVESAGEKMTAFVVTPVKKTVLVGYGNEAIKVAPMITATMAKPAIAINSLSRIERVAQAFLLGYDIYFAERVETSKETKKDVLAFREDPNKLTKFERSVYNALERLSIAYARNALFADIKLSDKQKMDVINEVERQANEKGKQEAKLRWESQYKGILTDDLYAGKFDVVIDATPGKTGAKNKDMFYKKAAELNPQMLFIYQGGEKKAVAEADFSNVSADYESFQWLNHVRHISCNTTGLTTITFGLMDALGIPLAIDNTAVRRVSDPGDTKGAVVSLEYQATYHHGDDLVSAGTPEQVDGLKVGLGQYRVATPAAQTGAVTMYHHHVGYVKTLDGSPLDINAVKKALMARPDVALIDMPDGIFDGTRIVEMAHNLLPQLVKGAVDGANHVLLPVVMVSPTDVPSEVRLSIAVPQESIVARGQKHAIDAVFNMGSKDASTRMVGDAVGSNELKRSIETMLAVNVGGTQQDGGITWKPMKLTGTSRLSMLAVQGPIDSKHNDAVFETAANTASPKVILIHASMLEGDDSVIYALSSANRQMNERLGLTGDENNSSNAYQFILVGDDPNVVPGALPSSTSIKALLEAIAQFNTKAKEGLWNKILGQDDMYDAATSISNPADLIKQLERMGVRKESIAAVIGPEQWAKELKQQQGISALVFNVTPAATGQVAFAGKAVFAAIEAVATPNNEVPAEIASRMNLVITANSIAVPQEPVSPRIAREIENYREEVKATVTRV